MNAVAPTSFRPLIRHVILRTSNASRLAEFYHRLLGLVPLGYAFSEQSVSLQHPTSGDILLTLVEKKAARPAPPGAPGLFHIAFLFAELDDWRVVVRKALALAGNSHGAADHGVSWAIYLNDPDGNGLELAWDKPSDDWPWHGDRIRMVSHALRLRSILLNDEPERESAGAFSIGHLHLQVSDLRDVHVYEIHLNLRITQSDYPGALFLARGRYHHHLAINTWRTRARATRSEGTTGLVGWDMTRDTEGSVSSWRDPTGSLVTLLPA